MNLNHTLPDDLRTKKMTDLNRHQSLNEFDDFQMPR